MKDFNGLLRKSPEERAGYREAVQKRIEADQKRNEVMIDKLYDQMSRGCIGNDWAEGFIEKMHRKIHGHMPYLTDKEQAKLEELFERY